MTCESPDELEMYVLSINWLSQPFHQTVNFIDTALMQVSSVVHRKPWLGLCLMLL